MRTNYHSLWLYIWLALCMPLGLLQAANANYREISSYRFASVRQTSPNGPVIREYYLYISVGFNSSNSVSSLTLKAPTGKKYAFRRWNPGSPWGGSAAYWEQYFGSSANQTKYLSLMPGGRYELHCGGGVLAGQSVAFDLPASLVNPCVPFLEKESFLLLNKRKLDPSRENTLQARRILKTGAPFVVQPQPSGAIQRAFVQIRDESASGDAAFVWGNSIQYDEAGKAFFTIPSGKLLKNKTYALSLQSDNNHPDASISTPEGSILCRAQGITYYELIFRTTK